MVVAMGILGVSFGVMILIFTQVVQTTNRAHMANEVRANASYALNQMMREIQGGERLPNGFTISPDCSTTFGSLNLKDSEDNDTVCFGVANTGVLTCRGLVRDNGCSGAGIFLTSELVDVRDEAGGSGLSFCRLSENKVRIRMRVQQCHQAAPPGGGGRPEYRGEIELIEEVTLRNYAGYQ